MRAELISIATVALAWGGYPLLARSSGVGGPLGALVLSLCALVPIAVAMTLQGPIARPSSSELMKLVIAGVLMGMGTMAFNFVVNSRRLEASISIPIIDTAMLVMSVIGAAVFFAEPMTLKKIVGIALLLAGILVLKPK
jgi:drug/metabolite transporter (DMT)-like permease